MHSFDLLGHDIIHGAVVYKTLVLELYCFLI